MIERGEDLALARDARREVAAEAARAAASAPRCAASAPSARSASHTVAHAADAERAHQAVGADDLARGVGRRTRRRSSPVLVRGELRQRARARHRPRRSVARANRSRNVSFRSASAAGKASSQAARSAGGRSSARSSNGLTRDQASASMPRRLSIRPLSPRARATAAARLLPVAPHGAFGDVEHLRDLGFGQAGEVAHLDHLRQAQVDPASSSSASCTRKMSSAAAGCGRGLRAGQGHDEHVAPAAFGSAACVRSRRSPIASCGSRRRRSCAARTSPCRPRRCAGRSRARAPWCRARSRGPRCAGGTEPARGAAGKPAPTARGMRRRMGWP